MTKTINEKNVYSEGMKGYEDAKEAVNHAKNAAKSLTGENVDDTVSQLVDGMKDFLNNRKSDVVNVKSKCRDHISDHPFSTILGAVLIGAIVGFILRK